MAMSSRIEMRITNPKLASKDWVNTAVCVRNPGPMAEVAIRKAAATMGEREINVLIFFIIWL
jgi:hypothetical protein